MHRFTIRLTDSPIHPLTTSGRDVPDVRVLKEHPSEAPANAVSASADAGDASSARWLCALSSGRGHDLDGCADWADAGATATAFCSATASRGARGENREAAKKACKGSARTDHCAG